MVEEANLFCRKSIRNPRRAKLEMLLATFEKYTIPDLWSIDRQERGRGREDGALVGFLQTNNDLE